MRSLGIATAGITDQYADGKAAKIWQLYIGDQNDRTDQYKDFLINLLKERNVESILDAACGTGVDSVMLLEQGFRVTSSDASDKMLKTAYKTRWDRRKEEAFDNWKITEANWLTLDKDVPVPDGGFDALICMGNSFAHLPAGEDGDQTDQRKCIENFYKLVRPGGLFIIDHRNYDSILAHGQAPVKNIYYNSSHIKNIRTSVVFTNNKPKLVTLDYYMNVEGLESYQGSDHFRLSYYPHTVEAFSNLLKSVFGPKSNHTVYADFKSLESEPNPGFYIHVVEKQC